jgi:hypothetical protein
LPYFPLDIQVGRFVILPRVLAIRTPLGRLKTFMGIPAYAAFPFDGGIPFEDFAGCHHFKELF